jgi:L-threonylcarbamoyladenylate synthase
MPVTLNPHDLLDEAVKVFKSGGIIAFPTETFYGLGVDPFNVKAIERLYLLKGRSFKDPISVVTRDREGVEELIEAIPQIAEHLIERFWPGPLTIVFKAREKVPPILTAHTGKIGVRIPGSTETLRLLNALRSPITATSANPAGKPPAVEAGEVLRYFNGDIDVLIDGGRLPAKKPSTVVDVTGGHLQVLREGAVATTDLSDLSS